MAQKVVLTGGPCAGKTSCLLALKARFGGEILTVPESATLLLSGGAPPPGHERIRSSADEWVHAFQGAILAMQQEMEDSFERLARDCGARLIVCDRGVLDGAAYWPEGREAFLRHFGLSLDECFARYRGVLHLQSLAEAHPDQYGREGNIIRYEAVAEALAVERAIRAAWEGHHGLVVIAAEADPHAKIARVLAQVETMMGVL